MRLIDADKLKDWLEIVPLTFDGGVDINDLMEHIDLMPAEIEWIPCSEQLPEDCEEVLVYLFDRPSPYIAWIEDTYWYTEDFEVDREDEPIAWMPLPEPYEEGKE